MRPPGWTSDAATVTYYRLMPLVVPAFTVNLKLPHRPFVSITRTHLRRARRGLTTDERLRVTELEREVRELKHE